jgi:predicted amidophosphoribosyltransferase|tara:strand:+ start:63 stop:281 length:219 start_codon:yes stop_codon:yes gene_type:complete
MVDIYYNGGKLNDTTSTKEDIMINCEFCGNVSTSTQVCTECGEPLVDNPSCWNEWDGQPDEAQEWHDFDPDC